MRRNIIFALLSATIVFLLLMLYQTESKSVTPPAPETGDVFFDHYGFTVDSILFRPNLDGPIGIWFNVKDPSEVILRYYNLFGQLVESVELECDPGIYCTAFPCQTEQASGIYFCKVLYGSQQVYFGKLIYLAGTDISSTRREWSFSFSIF